MNVIFFKSLFYLQINKRRTTVITLECHLYLKVGVSVLYEPIKMGGRSR